MTEFGGVTVVGAGAMGTGLAVHFARAGLAVTLVDHRERNLETARAELRSVERFLEENADADTTVDSVQDRIEWTLDLDSSLSGTDFVLETVSEDLETKRAVFAVLAERTEEAVLATNTSSLSISAIADGAPAAADRIVGCHWWYPPYLLTPVEVVAGERTSRETLRWTTAFVERVGRDPILVEKDVPGFVWNRVQFAVLRECMHLVDEGVASMTDVNRAVRDGYARRTAVVGPFETVDIAGLDLFRTIAAELYPHLCDGDAPSGLFDDALAAGRGGIRDGAGFFDYTESTEAVTRRRDEGLAALRAVLDAEGRSTGGSTGPP